MNEINKQSQILIDIFNDANFINLNKKEQEFIKIIAQNAYTQKGVFTVLTTLLFYKFLNPNQDIRYHKKELENGFSGRSFDTKVVTPTLRTLNLPAMAESGWLTRSLEQANPYTLDYKGKISNKELKSAFLQILDIVESSSNKQQGSLKAKDFLNALFVYVKEETKNNAIKIIPLQNADNLSITNIISMLNSHFTHRYNTVGGAKLPVIAFYAIYQILIKELKRYENCILKPLGKLTASDKTSRTAGDIEIIKNDKLYEAIEIKFNREIDKNIIDIAFSKIIKFSPHRYSIFSTVDIKKDDKDFIASKIEDIKIKHGCQVIINGVLPSIKYYLRLIEDLNHFIRNYSKLIEIDTDIKLEHKQKWNELIKNLNEI